MKKGNKGLIKDLIISLLIALAIILIVVIVCYDKISLIKIIPEAKEYKLSEEMAKDIKKNDIDKTTQIITKYYIDAADLKKYEQTKEYVKGKSNPFSEETANSLSTDVTNFYPNTTIK